MVHIITKNMKPDRTIEDWMYYIGWILAGLLLGVALLLKVYNLSITIPIPCILWSRFGVYCPGCGGTRAVIHLFHGRLLQSLWYHPLVMYVAVLYVIFMLSHTLKRLHIVKKGIKFREGYLYGAIAVLVGNFILKNIFKFCFGIVML